MRRQTQNRPGFTLVELMVAMALTLFVMVILSQAFATSLDTFSALKGIGDMQQNLRAATIVLRDDLRQDHFEAKRRLGDVSLSGIDLIPLQPPQAGFLAIQQGSLVTNVANAPYQFEGSDTNGMASYRATDHVLYMTVKRKGNRQENFFTAVLTGGPNFLTPFFSKATAYDIPAAAMPDSTLTIPYDGVSATGFYNSQWAEVVYYLRRDGSTDEQNLPTSILGTPTYNLYRAQYVMVPDGTDLKTSNIFKNASAVVMANRAKNQFGQMSNQVVNIGGATPFQLQFLTPADAALGNRIIPNLGVFNPQAAAPNAVTARALLTETLVCPNVLSFQVQIMRPGSLAFTDIPNAGTAGLVYDTVQMNQPAATYNNKFGLKAIQVTIRVWDHKTRQTRQVSIVQDM